MSNSFQETPSTEIPAAVNAIRDNVTAHGVPEKDFDGLGLSLGSHGWNLELLENEGMGNLEKSEGYADLPDIVGLDPATQTLTLTWL